MYFISNLYYFSYQQIDIHIHNLSPDLSDSNNELSSIASKALRDILSEYLKKKDILSPMI
jgi:hypothetical protein